MENNGTRCCRKVGSRKKERHQVVKYQHICRDRRVLWDCGLNCTDYISIIGKFLRANTW